MDNKDIGFLNTLEDVIRQRLSEQPASSYTAALAAAGDKRIAQKVGEEALELALAAVAGEREEQLNEACDLVYHLLVLLACKNLTLADVASQLRQRHEGTVPDRRPPPGAH